MIADGLAGGGLGRTDTPAQPEAGLKGFDLGTWFGLLAPAAAPKIIVARLDAELVGIVESPAFTKKKSEIGAEPIGDTPTKMGARIKADTERFAVLVKAAEVSLD